MAKSLPQNLIITLMDHSYKDLRKNADIDADILEFFKDNALKPGETIDNVPENQRINAKLKVLYDTDADGNLRLKITPEIAYGTTLLSNQNLDFFELLDTKEEIAKYLYDTFKMMNVNVARDEYKQFQKLITDDPRLSGLNEYHKKQEEKRKEEAAKIAAQKAEEAASIAAQKAEEAASIAAQKAEEAARIATQEAEEAARIATQEAEEAAKRKDTVKIIKTYERKGIKSDSITLNYVELLSKDALLKEEFENSKDFRDRVCDFLLKIGIESLAKKLSPVRAEVKLSKPQQTNPSSHIQSVTEQTPPHAACQQQITPLATPGKHVKALLNVRVPTHAEAHSR